MAAPVASIDIDPTSGEQTESESAVSVVLTDESTGDPAITEREWTVGGVVLDTDDEVVVADFIGVGVFAVSVEVTNADDSDDDAGTVTVTDGYVAPDLIDDVRIHPDALPAVYRDGISCTPGIPTSQRIHLARTFGTILPEDDRPTVLVGSTPVLAEPNP